MRGVVAAGFGGFFTSFFRDADVFMYSWFLLVENPSSAVLLGTEYSVESGIRRDCVHWSPFALLHSALAPTILHAPYLCTQGAQGLFLKAMMVSAGAYRRRGLGRLLAMVLMQGLLLTEQKAAAADAAVVSDPAAGGRPQGWPAASVSSRRRLQEASGTRSSELALSEQEQETGMLCGPGNINMLACQAAVC